MIVFAHYGGQLSPVVGYVGGLFCLVCAPIYAIIGARAEQQGRALRARRFKRSSKVFVPLGVLLLARAISGI